MQDSTYTRARKKKREGGKKGRRTGGLGDTSLSWQPPVTTVNVVNMLMTGVRIRME